MQRPLFIPVPTVLSTLLFITTITTAVFTSLLLLFYYCYFYKTVATDKPLRARLLSGAAELTTHLLRLISILWLPLCRINKLGFTTLEDCDHPIYLWVISGPHPTQSQARAQLRLGVVWAHQAPPGAPFWLLESSGVKLRKIDSFSNSEHIYFSALLEPKTAENRNWPFGILSIC